MTRALRPGTAEIEAKDLSDKMDNGSSILIRMPALAESDLSQDILLKTTQLQLLMLTVLNDNRTAGLSAIHAEPGTGKTIATIFALHIAEELKWPGVRVLLHGDFHQNLQDFFDVEDTLSAVFVAERVFSQLKAKGIRLHMCFDNTFDRGIAGDETFLMALVRASFNNGHHIIVITDSKESAKEVARLDGARTRLALYQPQDERANRWSSEEARRYLETKEEVVSLKEPKEREELIDKILNNTQIPDDFGLWIPVHINEYLTSGRKPEAPQSARPGTSHVWVRQLQKDDAGRLDLVGKAFKTTGEIADIDDLKKAIKKENPKTVPCDAVEIDIYLQQEDRSWKEEIKMSGSLRNNDEDSPYGYFVP